MTAAGCLKTSVALQTTQHLKSVFWSFTSPYAGLVLIVNKLSAVRATPITNSK